MHKDGCIWIIMLKWQKRLWLAEMERRKREEYLRFLELLY